MSSAFPEYEKKTANQRRPAFQVKKIDSPNCVWFTLENFELEKIPLMFVPADFQRKVSSAHIYRIVESIINNKFYDNTIRTVKLPNNKYEVIDGQHRLQALWILHKQYGVKTYTIIMQYFKTNEAREVFRKINSGKKLTTADHIKTLDFNGVPFFDELREFATHGDSKTTKISYYQLLNCLMHKRKNNGKAIRVHELEDTIKNISSEELSHLFRFAKAVTLVYLKTKSPRVFIAIVQRPLFVIGMENNYSVDEYVKALTKIINDIDLESLVHERPSAAHSKAYTIFKGVLNL